MTRPKRPQSSMDIEAEIRRLQTERERAIAAEDRRRGELLRGYLDGEHADTIRDVLRPVVRPRDADLFGLASVRGQIAPTRSRRSVRNAELQPSVPTPPVR